MPQCPNLNRNNTLFAESRIEETKLISQELLVCIKCGSDLFYKTDRFKCVKCEKEWPVLGEIPLFVKDIDAYIRTTLARAEVAKEKALGRLVQSLRALNPETEQEHFQHQSLMKVLEAQVSNFIFVEDILRPLHTKHPIEGEIDTRDLDPYLVGYGPIATFEYLLQDWRSDTDEALKLIDRYLPERCSRAVLLGSGAGRGLAVLADRAQEVIGVELSYLLARSSAILCNNHSISLREVRLNHVKRLSDRVTVHDLRRVEEAQRSVKVIVADATRTPLRNQSADWVVASLLFDLLPDGRLLLHEIRRIISPGGTVVILTMFGYEHDNLWNYYSPEQIVNLLKECGFYDLSVSWHEHSHLDSPKSLVTRRSQMLRIIARAA